MPSHTTKHDLSPKPIPSYKKPHPYKDGDPHSPKSHDNDDNDNDEGSEDDSDNDD